MSELKDTATMVIYGGTKEERKRYVDYMKKKAPEYVININPVFFDKIKKGPFTVENKKSIYFIFMDSPVVKQLDKEYLMLLFKAIDIYDFMDRQVKSLSAKQLERCSLLYDVLHGKNKVLIYDEEYDDKWMYFRITECLNNILTFRKNKGKIVWVTEMSIGKFLEYPAIVNKAATSIGELTIAYSLLPYFNQIYKIVDGKLLPAIETEDGKKAIIEYQSMIEMAKLLERKEQD